MLRKRHGVLGLAAAGCLLLGAFGAAPAFAQEFGLASLSTSSSSTQAGAHADVSTTFMLNSDSLGNPIDQLKDLRAELPPGLVGNPQAAPKCTHVEFEQFNCPVDSQVGVLDAFISVEDGATTTLTEDYTGTGDPSTDCLNDPEADGCRLTVADSDGFQGFDDNDANVITIGTGAGAVTTRLGAFPSDPTHLILQHPIPDTFTAGETVTHVSHPIGPVPIPLFNMEPSPGHVASFAASLLFVPLPPVQVDVDPDGSLTATISDESTFLKIAGSGLTLWGVPADPSHDAQRCDQLGFTCGQSAGVPRKPFMTNPTDCSSGPLTTTVSVASWQDPGTFDSMTSNQDAPTGCDALDFNPSISFDPDTSAADSPAGFSTHLQVPQNEDPDSLATPSLRKAVVNLPAGVSINGGAADGLAACTPAQIGLGNNNKPTCPNASKVGTAEIDTPLLAQPLTGSIFVNQDVGIYVVAEGGGVLIKLNGVLDRNPANGQLTATFDDAPQVPFSDLTLNFFGGPRATLATPPECGTYETTSELTPWSAPGSGAPATPSDSFGITTGPGGGPCSTPFAPSFQAGTQNPVAGASSPFILRLSRADGTEHLGSLDVDLPPGMLAKLAGVPQCTNGEATAAGCPAGSRIGGVQVGAGAGSNPLYLPGDVFLTQGYKGAPFGLAIVVRVLAGPFDFGTIVVRASLFIDQDDAQIHVVTDPIPDIHAGIPLRIRDIRVLLDRPDFTINPTTCTTMAVTGTAHGVDGGAAGLADSFQLGGCAGLPFAPHLSGAITSGRSQTKRSGHPNFQFDLTPRPGDANLSSVSLLLPTSIQVDQANLTNLCTEAELAQSECAGHSPIGQGTAATPLLAGQLAGPVYPVSGSGALPRLAVVLHGSATEPITLVVRANVEAIGPAIRNTFVGIPDAPIANFRLSIFGGPQGYLVNNTNLCGGKKKGKKGKKAKKGGSRLLASASFLAQNGDTRSEPVPIAAPCKKAKKGKKKK
jgi:hypothetical protein